MTSTRRVALWVATTLGVISVSACVEPPPPPPPPDPLLSCDTLIVHSEYVPPATSSADDVSGTLLSASGLVGCTDYTGHGISGASASGTFQLEGACSYHPPGEAWGWGTGTLDWSDGSSSDWTAELISETPLRVELHVTGGLWTGANASLPMDVTGVVGDCAAGGITEVVIQGGLFVLHPAGSPGAPPLDGVQEITAGADHTCALLEGATVQCWGDNAVGQLGNDSSGAGLRELLPVDVVGLGPASAVSAGDQHTCAIVAGGQVRCWGQNGVGQLGDGTGTSSDVPVDVVGLSGATAVSAGSGQTCAIAGGSVSCWGSGSLAPVAVPGITDATQVSVGGSPFQSGPGPHACALVGGGDVVCWGNNAFGQLGDGTNSSSPTPVAVTGLTGATDVVAGPYATSCAVVQGGVQCWGRNDFSQLGDGTTTPSNVPVAALGVSTATSVGLGAVHGCARLADGGAACWGDNSYGQLGNGTLDPSTSPAPVQSLSDATSIAVGHYSTCAPRSGGFASCWGANGSGQLGTGDRQGAPLPEPVMAGF